MEKAYELFFSIPTESDKLGSWLLTNYRIIKQRLAHLKGEIIPM